VGPMPEELGESQDNDRFSSRRQHLDRWRRAAAPSCPLRG
jgi:hypothetical protein